MSGENQDGSPSEATTWRLAELLFGGGVIVWALSTAVAGVWWSSAIETRLSAVEASEVGINTKIDSLDNVALGNRITALETQIRNQGVQQDKIEGKIDRLLDRSR